MSWMSWDEPLDPNLHAIGAISTAYNDLEFGLYTIFHHFMNDTTGSRVPAFLFGKIDNERRLYFLREWLQSSKMSEPAIGTIHNFLDGYQICAENRNAIMHSKFLGTSSADEINPTNILQRRSKSGFDLTAEISVNLEILRKIADEIRRFDMLSFVLFAYLKSRTKEGKLIYPHETPLPDKLPLPEKLIRYSIDYGSRSNKQN